MAAKQEALRSKDPKGENSEASEFKFCRRQKTRRAFTARRRREWICQRQIAEQSECRDEHKRPPLGGASQ